MSLREGEKISVEIASIATGEIPKSYVAFGNLIWEVFRLGQKYNQIQEREAKEELLEGMKVIQEELNDNCISNAQLIVKQFISKYTEKDKEVI